jgi:hypothetical protein
VAEIVGQRDSLGQVFVEFQAAGDGTGDLGHFQGMRQPSASADSRKLKRG